MAGSSAGAPGVGKGRRMPIQQSVDIGVPVESVYNQWTQFEDWPSFMHRVTRVSQEDECTVSFATKIWGKTKEFTADIETQRPNERIKWSVSQGMTHTGVVTFHELAPNLTRVLLSFDVEPGSLIEKAARGMRHVKRAARADLHRFKALIEMAGLETGAWRGRIEDGEVVEEHDPEYDEQRAYADVGDLVDVSDKDEDEEQDERQDEGEKQDENERDDEADQEDQPDGESEGRRERNQSRASSARRASRSRGSSGSRSGSSGGRSRSSRGSRSSQASGGGTRSTR